MQHFRIENYLCGTLTAFNEIGKTFQKGQKGGNKSPEKEKAKGFGMTVDKVRYVCEAENASQGQFMRFEEPAGELGFYSRPQELSSISYQVSIAARTCNRHIAMAWRIISGESKQRLGGQVKGIPSNRTIGQRMNESYKNTHKYRGNRRK